MPSSITSTKPLIKRPLDLFYFTYFIFNVITFLFIDGQNFYPSKFVPEALKRVVQDYLQDSGDPFVLALRSHDRQYIWFATSMWSSLVFQNPVYLLAIWGLWKDEKRIYPIMASYGMLAGITTLQCLTSVIWGADGDKLSSSQTSYLLKAYVPFIIIPFVMLLDTTIRSWQLIQIAIDQQKQIVDSVKSKKRL